MNAQKGLELDLTSPNSIANNGHCRDGIHMNSHAKKELQKAHL